MASLRALRQELAAAKAARAGPAAEEPAAKGKGILLLRPHGKKQVAVLATARPAVAAAQRASRGQDDGNDADEGEGEACRTSRLPHGYDPSQRILLVGEGDCSFARALTRLMPTLGANLIATTFDSEAEMVAKYDGALSAVDELAAAGATVIAGVDATRLSECLHVGGKKRKAGAAGVLDTPLDRIVFNFPHLGLGVADQAVSIAQHRALLKSFLTSAAPLLSPRGEIHIALKYGEPYTSWGVVQLAQAAGLQTITVHKWDAADWPGYAHRRTAGHVEGVSAPANAEVAKRGASTTVLGPPRPGGGKKRGRAAAMREGKKKRAERAR